MNKFGLEVLGTNQQPIVGQKCYDHFNTQHCKTQNCSCGKAMNQNAVITAENFEKINSNLEMSTSTISGYISEVLTLMSNGNLDVEINKEYLGDFVEIKTSLNVIITSLNRILGDINRSAEQVESGSIQVATSGQALAQGATAEETASASEELTSLAGLLKETLSQFKIKKNVDSANMEEEYLSPKMINIIENIIAEKNLDNTSNTESKESADKLLTSINLTGSGFGKY